ncbi:MAG TPA: hypothetical protein VHV82_18010 [Sporichthyaceae bacterium]|nr:hypothetical protein [Sporichthyaceae bacterium]
MSLSFRCGARVAAVALTATVVLVGGQVQSADAADSTPGRSGGCLREGSIFDFQCPVMPAPESPYRRPLHVQSAPHAAPSAWSRSRARHIDHAEHSDAPVHAYGHEVHPVSHRAVPAPHPVEQVRNTQARPHTEQAFAHRPARTVTPAQHPASTPAAQTTEPSAQTVAPAQQSAPAPAANPPAQQSGKPSVQSVAPPQHSAPAADPPAQQPTAPTVQAVAPVQHPAETPSVNPPAQRPTQPKAHTEAASRGRTAPRTHTTAHRLEAARAHVKRHLPHSGY